MKISKKNRGFTLIELLIVIAIIGVLAVAFLPSLLGAPAKSRDAQRLTAVQKLQTFMVSQSATTGPAGLPAAACIAPVTAATACSGAGSTISGCIFGNISAFGGVFPRDPQPALVGNCPATGGFAYYKWTGAAGTPDIGVFARVENAQNANYDCAAIPAATGPGPATLTAQGTVAANAAQPCYGALLDL